MAEPPVPMEARKELLQTAYLPRAIARTKESLEIARTLQALGLRSPAFVWAVRSGEIFIREALLFPIEFEQSGDEMNASKRVRDLFKGGKWGAAIKRVRAEYDLNGEDHLALIEGGEDAFEYWGREGVGRRGEVVHGRDEVTDDESVIWALAFVEQMQKWFTLRAIASSEGPLANTLRDIFESAAAEHRRQQEQDADDDR